MSKTVVKPRHNGTIKSADEPSPLKNGRGHSCSPLKRLKPSEDVDASTAGNNAASPGACVDSDDAELARKLHEQLNGPDSPTAAPITRHITRVRKAPTFYKPEQPRGYGGYHGTEGGQEPEGVQEREEGPAEASPRHVKENHIPRELQRLHEHSLSLSDSEAKSNHPRRTRASSVPDPTSATAPPRQQLATQSADQGVNKKRSDVKTEEDAETHSRCGPRQRSKQRSSTPELRLTRSMQPPAELQPPHKPPADQRRTGRSLPVKLEQQGATGEQAALHQGSSGSPGKGAGSSSQPGGQDAKRRGSKAVGKDADAAVKAEVTSSRLRQSTGGGSTSGESHSHVHVAAACQDQGDAVGGSGRRNSDSTAAGVSKRAKLPAKNPMVLQKQNGSYYRVRVLEEKAQQVKIEFMGFEQQLQPVWLARDSERIWRGSYKNKAWKHLGDGAWEPRCGEKRAPAVAHGTHQNQYTKRRALLNCASNHTSSNNDSDDNMVGSEDGTQRDRQHGHFAETGFAAQTSAGSDENGDEQVKQSNAAAQDADSGKVEAALPVGESGVLSRQQGGESSGRHKGRAHVSSDESKKSRRRKQNLRDADASSGDRNVPVETNEAAEGPAQPHRRKDASAHTGNRASRATAYTATPVAAHVVTDRLPSRKSGEEEEGLIDGAGATAELRGAAPDAAVDQCATAAKSAEDILQAHQPSAKGSAGAAGLQSDSDPTEAATSSGTRHGKGQAGSLAPQQKAGSSKGQSGLEAALQCEEHLADDVAAPSGAAGATAAAALDAATDAATKAADKAADDSAKAVEAEAAPKPVVKPRRDRKGRIRGTYGINAKPVEVQTPTESPPAPGVTRASLRPKPVAKASPDDEQSEGAKPTAAAAMRHARAAASGPDAGGAAPESPGSPQHSKGSVPEARRPNGRSAIQRRAAAANFAVAAAVAAEAADAIPMTRDNPICASSKSQHNHRRLGGLGPSKTGLDLVRSGRITKTVSGGSSGGGSSGGSARFSSLMDALGDMEARQGSFRPQQQLQQLRPTRTLSLGEPNGVPSSGASQRPALFDRGFVSRWHEPVGPVSPSILTLSSDLFQLGPSPFVPESWNAPSICHSSLHAGHGVQPQYPLFKTRECAG